VQGGEKAKAQTPPPVVKLAVRSMPGSGTPEELMDAAGISAAKIVEAVKAQLK
jgi:transketolase